MNLFPKAFAQFVRLCSWIYHMAHLVNAETSREEAQSQLLMCVTNLRQSCPYDTRLHVVAYMEKITVALTPQLFEYLVVTNLLRPYFD